MNDIDHQIILNLLSRMILAGDQGHIRCSNNYLQAHQLVHLNTQEALIKDAIWNAQFFILWCTRCDWFLWYANGSAGSTGAQG